MDDRTQHHADISSQKNVAWVPFEECERLWKGSKKRWQVVLAGPCLFSLIFLSQIARIVKHAGRVEHLPISKDIKDCPYIADSQHTQPDTASFLSLECAENRTRKPQLTEQWGLYCVVNMVKSWWLAEESAVPLKNGFAFGFLYVKHWKVCCWKFFLFWRQWLAYAFSIYFHSRPLLTLKFSVFVLKKSLPQVCDTALFETLYSETARALADVRSRTRLVPDKNWTSSW